MTASWGSARFWDDLSRGTLSVVRCVSCGRFPPLAPRRCPFCHSETLAWVEASGRGRLASFTVVHRAPSPAFTDEVPYVLALVDLDEGARMMARLVGPRERLRVGARLRWAPEPRAVGPMLPTFALEET